jgi:autotransporter adhesin
VNVAQLKSAGLIDVRGRTLDAIVYDTGSGRSSVTLGGIGASSVVTLTNLAAGRIGKGSTDAVNGDQLFSLTSRVDALEQRAPSPGHDKVNPDRNDPRSNPNSGALSGRGQRISDVRAGVEETDAVNLGQLNAAFKANLENANAHTDAAIGEVRMEMEHDRKDAKGGSASAIATANLPQAYPGESMLSVAGGTYGGQSAVALGLSTATRSWTVKASFSSNTRGSYGGGVGAGYRF